MSLGTRTIFALLLLATPAAAQPDPPLRCDAPADMAVALQQRFGETAIAEMLSKRGLFLTLYVNAETGTYTTVGVSPQALDHACIVDFGVGYEAVVLKLPGSPS